MPFKPSPIIVCHCGDCKPWRSGASDNETWQCSAAKIHETDVLFKLFDSVDTMMRHDLLNDEKVLDTQRDELLALRATSREGCSIGSFFPGPVGMRVRHKIWEFHDL